MYPTGTLKLNGERNMNKEKKTFFILCASLVVLLAVLFWGGNRYYSRYLEKSDLHTLMLEYQNAEQEWDDTACDSYEEGSGEWLFLRGMNAYIAQDYPEAKALFEQGALIESRDPALYAYLCYYTNQCIYYLEGTGSDEMVAQALEAASYYTPLSNDRDRLWDLISSISFSEGSDEKAIALMQDYLERATNLELATWARLKNCIAALEYNNEAYAKSIRNFYDVELALEKAGNKPEIRDELQYAREYIANIYYLFEDYEGAAKLYQELIDQDSANEEFRSYGCSLNMAGAYLEIGDTERARAAVQYLEQNLSRVDELFRPEVEASMQDILTNICIKEKDYAQAEEYLKQAEAYYRQEKEEAAFFGGVYHTMVSRARYVAAVGETETAGEMLEELLEDPQIEYYDLEEECLELLCEIYQETGEREKLLDVTQKLLELDQESAQTMQREYLEFSKYYRENNQLKEHNLRLSRHNMIAVFATVIISCILVVILAILRLLSKKNLTDQLTGVYNRKKLTQMQKKYSRTGTPEKLGIVMMDIDYFKRYNDTYGHPGGDEVLRRVANVLKNSVRSKDTIIRYGGEEFLILLSGTSAKTAEEICARIQSGLKKEAIPHMASEVSEYVTLSMGLCYQSDANMAGMEQLIAYADESLYQSKESGRNCVTIKVLS